MLLIYWPSFNGVLALSGEGKHRYLFARGPKSLFFIARGKTTLRSLQGDFEHLHIVVCIWRHYLSLFGFFGRVSQQHHKHLFNYVFDIFSQCFSDMKLNIVDAQNAVLSGGVAVGAIADLVLHPYGALIIGSCAGMLSTIGYQIVQVSLTLEHQHHFDYLKL